MAFGLLAGLGVSLLGGALSADSANRKARRARNQAIKDAKYQTPEELEWLRKTRTRAREGMEDIGRVRNLAMQPIRATGQQMKSQAVGQAIRQGLENSIIAQEIRNKMDAKTRTEVTKMSEKIAIMNEQYKKQQEGKVDQYQMDRSRKIYDITSQANQQYIQNRVSAGDVFANTIGNFGGHMFGSQAYKDSVNDFMTDGFSTWF